MLEGNLIKARTGTAPWGRDTATGHTPHPAPSSCITATPGGECVQKHTQRWVVPPHGRVGGARPLSGPVPLPGLGQPGLPASLRASLFHSLALPCLPSEALLQLLFCCPSWCRGPSAPLSFPGQALSAEPSAPPGCPPPCPCGFGPAVLTGLSGAPKRY